MTSIVLSWRKMTELFSVVNFATDFEHNGERYCIIGVSRKESGCKWFVYQRELDAKFFELKVTYTDDYWERYSYKGEGELYEVAQKECTVIDWVRV